MQENTDRKRTGRWRDGAGDGGCSESASEVSSKTGAPLPGPLLPLAPFPGRCRDLLHVAMTPQIWTYIFLSGYRLRPRTGFDLPA